MAGPLRHYFSMLYGSTEQDDCERDDTDKHVPIELEEDIDVIDITDEDDVQNVSDDQNKIENAENSPENNLGEQLKCKICLKQFHNEKTLKNHLDMHILYSHNECALCHKVFTLKRNLKRHQAVIHFIDTGIYYCLTCPKIFTHTETLSNHTRLCRSDQPKCYMCSAELESFDDLSVHQENEHNLRGYVCGFCATSLPTEEELGTHLDICKLAPVGEDNKWSADLRYSKKVPLGAENICPNTKEAHFQNKMSRVDGSSIMSKIKKRKRARNEAE